MQGDTIIFASQPEHLRALQDDSEAIDNFEHCDFTSLALLDCEMACSNLHGGFCEGEPIVFNEDRGLAIMKVSSEALRYVIEHSEEFAQEQHDDIQKLERFTAKHGFEHIYMLSGF